MDAGYVLQRGVEVFSSDADDSNVGSVPGITLEIYDGENDLAASFDATGVPDPAALLRWMLNGLFSSAAYVGRIAPAGEERPRRIAA